MDYATPNPMTSDPNTDSPSIKKAAADLGHAAAEAARDTASNVQSKAASLKQAATEKAQQFRTLATEKASALKQGAVDKAYQVKQVATDKFQQSSDKAKDIHASAEDYIRANPTKAVLAALGTGVLIGLLAARRR